MNRALAVLACAAYLTLVLEVTASDHPLPALLLGAAYTLYVTVAFGWVRRPGRRRERAIAIGYVAGALVLGAALVPTVHDTVGASLLLVVLVCQCVLLLPLPVAIAATAAVPLMHLGMPWDEGLRAGIGSLVGATFGVVVTALLERERMARTELADAHERLRAYAAQSEELATTQERNRVARDIHDGLGHYLTVVQMQVKAARAVLAADPARADDVLAKAEKQATEALAEVRRSVAALRERRAVPPLPEGLQTLIDETSAAGVPTGLDVVGETRELPTDTEEALYRMAQEALTNVRKHARANHAQVMLDYDRPAVVRLRISDDGEGLPPGERRSGFGLMGLRERAERLGGRVTIDSTPDHGVTLSIEVPG